MHKAVKMTKEQSDAIGILSKKYQADMAVIMGSDVEMVTVVHPRHNSKECTGSFLLSELTDIVRIIGLLQGGAMAMMDIAAEQNSVTSAQKH